MNPLFSLGEALLRAGAPLVGGLLTTAATAAGGPVAGAAAGLVIGALAEALGLDPKTATPAEVQAKIDADPAAAREAAQRVEASHGQAAADLAARLADVQDARETTVQLVQAGSAIAWGAPVISVLIVGGFLALVGALLFRAVPDSQVTLVLFGSLSTAFGSVVSYWLGSSSGSKDKDAMLAALAAAPPALPPAPRPRSNMGRR